MSNVIDDGSCCFVSDSALPPSGKNVGTALVVEVMTHSIRKTFISDASKQIQTHMRLTRQMRMFDV
jgi:hypothetical protein